ncbi:MAG TPA: PqqD family peptide modification chaperone [Gemmatimonadota bacterium]|nr:PqqD family peptide modification chaperone [Gemmatimonadota bacterium]
MARREAAVFVLPLDEAHLLAQEPVEDGEASAPLALAAALTASPLWKGMEEAILVLRPGPRPLLSVLGHFDEAEAARVRALTGHLPAALSRLRYVGYPEAERACERLASRLSERLGADAVSEAFFVAIPRGGLVVLGLLAYSLDLRSEQLETFPPPGSTLVIVDDCSLTGLRFARFLEGWPDRRIAFAPLYSHPDLRRAIVAREPEVIACESGDDLHDHAPERLGAEYEAWRRRWTLRSDPRCYWIGQPDHLCFPWSEPTVAFWNPVTEKEEAGWRIGSPERCYANRLRARTRPVQVQPRAAGPLGPSPTVVFGELNGDVLAADTESGAAIRLEGPAADMWRAIVERGTADGALRRLLDIYAVEEGRLREDLARFIGELKDRGFLGPDEGPIGPYPG